jgi:Ca-activated chloride channel family protein
MLIEDFRIGGVSVNRLTAAKRVMRDFIKGRDNDRVGIVAFAGAPYTPCPLTLDHEWLESNIDRVQTGVMEDGTAIGSGLAAAARRLDQQKVPSKVIILLTDGANNSGKLSPQDAARLAATLGIKIYTIAIGTPGVHMIPLPNGRIITSGRQEFDEDTLKEVARIGSGQFYMAQNTDALKDIFNTIDQLEKTEIKRRTRIESEEWCHWFAIAGLGFAAVGGLAAALSLGSRRGGLLIAVIALPLFAPPVIFGAGAVARAQEGLPTGPALALLAAYALAAAALSPFAGAAAIRSAQD